MSKKPKAPDRSEEILKALVAFNNALNETAKERLGAIEAGGGFKAVAALERLKRFNEKYRGESHGT